MSLPVKKGNHPIPQETRNLISKRYKTITKAVNKEFRDINNDSDYSFYVGSYGRGTAVNTSDLDVLVELPNDEYEHFKSSKNGASRLLQAVKNAIINSYPMTDIKADGQVVVVNFFDKIKFEILPAFKNIDCWGNWNGTYIYPDSHMGGNWLTTNPKAEQQEMKQKNSCDESNGLLFDTCKHIRYIRNEYYSSYHLSGILIDTFVYRFINNWRWCRDGEDGSSTIFEDHLLITHSMYPTPPYLYAPGSDELIDTEKDWDTLGKVLRKIAG